MENENQAWLRAKPGSVCLKDGLLTWERGDPKDRYDPFELSRSLINAVARIRDAESAIKFMERYGPMGYYELTTRALGGEPLEWVLGQADTVRFALSVIAGLEDFSRITGRKVVRLEDVLRERQVPKYRGFMNAEHGVFAVYSVAIGARFPVETLPFRLQNPPARKAKIWVSDEAIIREHGRDVVAFLVRHNVGNVRRVLISSEGKLRLRHEFGSLIGVVWYLVGEEALLRQEGKGTMAICDECGLPFVASRKPAKGQLTFCPPVFWQNKKYSLCGLNNRMKRLRAKK